MSLQVRIFPHSKEQFPSEDSLRTWLLTSLRGRGGVYYLKDARQISEVSPGCVVLFRYDKNIVGEAVVWKEKDPFREPMKNKTLTGDEAEYTGCITFHPSSIRLYAPPVPVNAVQPYLKKDV